MAIINKKKKIKGDLIENSGGWRAVTANKKKTSKAI
jgi:hypothetical protein